MHDYLVIGGGLIGLLTARELALGGASVRVVEQGRTGQESSWAGGGILSPLYPWRYPDGVTELARWSQDHYRILIEALALESGVDAQWTQSGMLMLDGDERDEAVAWAVRFGYTLEELDREGILRCEQALSETYLSHALWMPDVAQLRNPRLLQALRLGLQQFGVVIDEQCEVSGLRVAGGTVQGVETAGGPIECERVVVAAGAWSGRLLQGLGLELAVRPVRGQMLLLRGTPGLFRRIILHRDHYLIPRRDGRVLVGSTMEEAGFDKSTTDEAAETLRRAAQHLIPELADCPLEQHWSGLRPGSPQGVPYIGEHPGVRGLFLNTGHFRNGVVMGYASARLLADLALGREPELDPAPYAPGRGEGGSG